MPHHLYVNDGDPDDPDPQSVARVCDELAARISKLTDGRTDPGLFPDPYKAIRDRDNTIDVIGNAVITLAHIVKDLAKDVDELADGGG